MFTLKDVKSQSLAVYLSSGKVKPQAVKICLLTVNPLHHRLLILVYTHSC